MTRYVALLRAINVGGHIVKMDRLRAICEAIPLSGVSTFIASGNLIFQSKKPAAQLEAAIEKRLRTELGYEVTTMVRTCAEVSAIVAHVEAHRLGPGGGVRLYVGFLKTTPSSRTASTVAALSNETDALSVHGRELYWRSSAGKGREHPRHVPELQHRSEDRTAAGVTGADAQPCAASDLDR
jgi:uncharacterized protein (DUF1697 family)